MKFKTIILPLFSIILIMSGCGGEDLPDENTSTPTRLITKWDIGSSSSRTVSSADFPESKAVITTEYSSYGNLLISATPEKFTVPFDGLSLFAADSQAALGPTNIVDDAGMITAPTEEDAYADFTAPVISSQSFVIDPGTYFMVELSFMPANGLAWGGSIEGVDFVLLNQIEVVLPGYTDTELPNIVDNMDGSLTGEAAYSRYYLGDNKFRFSWEELTGQFDSYNIHNIAFCPAVTAPLVAIEGYDGLSSTPGFSHSEIVGNDYTTSWEDFTTNKTMGATAYGNLPAEITIAEGDTVAVSCTLDIENIVNVYDNSLIGDKSDDIVRFVPDFWERFTVYFVKVIE